MPASIPPAAFPQGPARAAPARAPLGRRILNPILRFLIRMFLRVEASGADGVPATGAGIVYYNHIHWLDPVVICSQLPRYAVPLAKVETSRWPLVGWLLRTYHTIFITRGVVDRAALQATWRILQDGGVSVISPEGTRSPDTRLLTAKEGLAFVARQAPDAWLLPAAVTGTPAFKWKFPFIGRPTATIVYGRAFYFDWPRAADGSVAAPDGRAARGMMREMTDEAMGQLAALLPEAMRDAYAAAAVGAAGVAVADLRWLQFGEPRSGHSE